VNTDFTFGDFGSTGTSPIYTDIAQSAAKTSSTGTGAVTLNGEVNIAKDKNFHMNGQVPSLRALVL